MRGITLPGRTVKAWEMLLAIAGIILLLTGAFLIHRSALPRTDVVIAGADCHTPATILDPPTGVTFIGSAVVLHGLGANRRTMMYLGADFAGHGFRTYLLDLPGHGDNTDGFTFAKAQRCADATVASLLRDGRIDDPKTVLVGHSMGGAIAIRMADAEPVAATVALSPAPMENPRRLPANLLVLSAQWDLEVLKRQAQALDMAAGGERTAPEDFAELRAFALQTLPHATHTSPLIDHGVAHRTEQWAMQAMFPAVDAKTIAANLDQAAYDTRHRGGLRLAGAVLGLLGIWLLFPAFATLAASAAGPPLTASPAGRPAPALTIAEESVCALVSVLALSVFVPLKFVHLYDGDYLASLLLLSGGLMLALNWRYATQNLAFHGRRWCAGLILALALILGAGAWFTWQVGDLWLNAARWLRFAELFPLMWLFSFAEEVVLGEVGDGSRRARRFVLFLVLRLEIYLACILAYYMLDNGEALIGLFIVGLAAFSIFQRLATDAFRLRTGSPTAAAVFGAILASWFIAAVFPLS